MLKTDKLLLREFYRTLGQIPGIPHNPIPDHRRVFDAIAASNAEAALIAMRALVDLALDDTSRSME